MKKLIAALPLFTLAACGGGGLDTVGSTAPPPGAGTGTGTGTGTGETHSFVKPTQVKTYQAVGAAHSLQYGLVDFYTYNKKTETANGTPTRVRDDASRTLVQESLTSTLYQGQVNGVRSGGIEVSYDPKNAIYTLKIAQGGVENNITFQDPAHHTAFGGASEPQAGVPNLEQAGLSNAQWRDKGVQYYQVFQGDEDNSDFSTFFLELPGTSTQYVTYAGYVRNYMGKPGEIVLSENDDAVVTKATAQRQFDRAAFAFGENTPIGSIPKSGTASFSGTMIASSIVNPTLDSASALPSYFQWMSGTAALNVNFATNSVTASMTGTTLAPFVDRGPVLAPAAGLENRLPDATAVPAGATFTATGQATIDLVGTGGFAGGFNQAGFTWNNGASKQDVDITGSSLTGAFYGPGAEEVGGAFRIVGGVPDQRVDVLGAFTAKK